MEEVVGREETLFAVDDRLDTHGELSLTGEVMKEKSIFAPAKRVAVARRAVKRDGPRIQERRPQKIGLRQRRRHLVERPDLEFGPVRQIIDAVVMIEVGMAKGDDFQRAELLVRLELEELVGTAFIPWIEHKASVVLGHQDI